MDTNALQSSLADSLSNESYDQWVTQYDLRDKVHCPANLRHELDDPGVKCRFEISDGPVTDTGIHRRHDICLMPTWALCM